MNDGHCYSNPTRIILILHSLTDRANCEPLATKDTQLPARVCPGRTVEESSGLCWRKIAQAFGQGEDPLPCRHLGKQVVHQMRTAVSAMRRVCARGADPAPLAGVGNQEIMLRTPHSGRGPQSRYRRRSRSAWHRITPRLGLPDCRHAEGRDDPVDRGRNGVSRIRGRLRVCGQICARPERCARWRGARHRIDYAPLIPPKDYRLPHGR